jgi:FlaA1/EpsC-like NDP-sugar epimerase
VTGRTIRTVIGDCTDAAMVFSLFADVRPDVVIHYTPSSRPHPTR